MKFVDDKIRCFGSHSEIYAKYHDEEWGVESRNDEHLFEMLLLESAHAGLSWELILNKREGYRRAFDDFDYRKISEYTEEDVERLLLDSGIVRNRLKVQCAIKNARIFMKIQEEFGSFSNYLWKFANGKQIDNCWTEIDMIPTSTELSDEISKDLKKRGMGFVGSVIVYSFLQAVGVVNDHFEGCCCRVK